MKHKTIWTVQTIVSQRSSLELASLVTKAGSCPQKLWPILYDIGVSQVATQLRQFKNVQIILMYYRCFVNYSFDLLYRKLFRSCFSKFLPLFIIQGKIVIAPNGITAIGLQKLTIPPKFYQKTMSRTKKFNKLFKIILVAILKSTLYFVAIQMRDNQVFCTFVLFLLVVSAEKNGWESKTP